MTWTFLSGFVIHIHPYTVWDLLSIVQYSIFITVQKYYSLASPSELDSVISSRDI